MAEAQTITDALADWVGRQRWFVGKGRTPMLRCLASVPLHADEHLEVRILFVKDQSGSANVLYQVPIVLRRQARETGGPGRIGEVPDADGGTWHLYDGPEDPEFTARLRHLISAGESARNDSARLSGIRVSAWPSAATESRVLRGEQSNTSIVFSAPADDSASSSVICKIFRMLHHGENPDVVLQSALFTSGSESVPPIFGSVVGQWPDASRPDGLAHGHLAFAQGFLAGAEDAWGLALAAARNVRDFAESAHQIGVATADIHATLARARPTQEAASHDIEAMAAGWRTRLDAALQEVPELAPLRPTVEKLYDRAANGAWPRLQSIHGDLHLGQILATPDGSWVIIDFEGEPMRPLAERSMPDVTLRDVAGMLRSFDYAAGSQEPSAAVSAWADSCRSAFLDGYAAGSDNRVQESRALLDAFELDKALYEVVYEARNRPTWLEIPTSAVRRLAGRAN